AVGREADLLSAAERLGRYIANQITGQRNARTNELAAGHREAKQPRADARFLPRVPVANEQLVKCPARTGFRFRWQSRAIEVGAAKVAIRPDHDAIAARRHLEPADV